MSVKQKILHDIKARNPKEFGELKSKKVQKKSMSTKRDNRYIHRNRTFKRIIGGLLVYIFIMVIFITLIFSYLG